MESADPAHDRAEPTAGAPRRLRLALVGDESLVVQCARTALGGGDEVVLLATRSEAVREAAGGDGVHVVDARDLLAELRRLRPHVLLSVANEFVLGAEVLDAVPLAVNFHDGPLPARGGVGVTTWALLDGDERHGITWHEMTPAVDAGVVLLAEELPIAADETALSLNARCYEAGLATFPALLDLLRAMPDGRARPASGEPAPVQRFHGRYERPLELLDATVPAERVARAVRALDVGPRIRNRLGRVRWIVDSRLYLLAAAGTAPPSGLAPGTVVAADEGVLRIATATDDLLVSAVDDPDGHAVALERLVADHALTPGRVLAGPGAGVREGWHLHDHEMARHETAWVTRLHALPATLPAHLDRCRTPAGARPAGATRWGSVELGTGSHADDVLAGLVVWWARTSADGATSFEWHDADADRQLRELAPLLRAPVVAVTPALRSPLRDVAAAVRAACDDAARLGPFLRDLVARTPALRAGETHPLLAVSGAAPTSVLDPSVVLALEVRPDGGARLHHRLDVLDEDAAARVADEIDGLLDAARSAPDAPAGELPLAGRGGAATLAALAAPVALPGPRATIDARFREQAARAPHAPALTGPSGSRTYGELHADVERLTARLRLAGVRRGDRVGISLERDLDLVVSVLAILSAGAAYVPLDPDYPEDRLRFVIADAGLAALVARPATAERFAPDGLPVVDPADDAGPAAPPSPLPGAPGHEPDDLAYVIYTSGSTGRPKGVMLEHRNVDAFFAAMDGVIDHDPPGTWLAVTSLSFDISVLELLWTLTRGFHVVLHRPPGSSAPTRARTPGFSLFYFAAGGARMDDAYRLLLDSARFADEQGFEALWVPERHFHDFGGAYPNPSVIAAALATTTRRIGLRAGSVVLPLHPSARVAEDWAVVDQLSGGRVGISFAPGWQPRDFVLNPGGHADARTSLGARIEEVRRLWRGDAVEMTGPDGTSHPVATLPRPVQPELPVWLTSAGTPATFERAGRAGYRVLTHLLGQSVEQLAANVDAYRAAWREAGHAGEGHVTLMLHTFLDADGDAARDAARQPLQRYLRSVSGLLRGTASSFPTFAGAGADADAAFDSLDEHEVDELAALAAERYLHTSGLFGTPAEAASRVVELARCGVDEVACLVDFGVDPDRVLASLPAIAEARELAREQIEQPARAEAGDASVAALVARHQVTHLQCTPSLAAMLLADDADRRALTALRHLLVGGEALPEPLCRDLRAALRGRLTNMYGPTETTIWSLVHEITPDHSGPVPIGRPIAGTSLRVLDQERREVPIGALGELHLGGAGVARGYLDRPELTAERFVPGDDGLRWYATGDLARLRPDGVVEFAGRVDHQVKIRGHRVELGEIESALDRLDGVARSAVVVRGEPPATRVLAFLVPRAGTALDPDGVRRALAAQLPPFMVPDAVAVVASLPLTPNGKVDRGALPDEVVQVPVADRATRTRPAAVATTTAAAPVHTATRVPAAGADAAAARATAQDHEAVVADLWTELLGRVVGRDDHFFDIGGHSLLAVAVLRRLQDTTGLPLALTDVFRHPTVATLGAHLHRLARAAAASVADPAADPAGDAAAPTGPAPAAPAAPSGGDRGALRRRTLQRARSGG